MEIGKNLKKNYFEFSLISKYRTLLMGIGVLNVMMLHSLDIGGYDNNLFVLILRNFCGMVFTEGFILLSGFGCFYSFSRNQRNICKFYKKRINRVWIPFIIMSFPFYLYFWGVGIDSFPMFLMNVTSIRFWIVGHGFWYIATSLVFYAIFPLLFKFIFVDIEARISVFYRFIYLILASVFFLYLLKSIVPNYYYMTKVGLVKLPYFIIGIFLGYLSFTNQRISLQHLIHFIFLFVIIFLCKKYNQRFTPIYDFSFRLLSIVFLCLISKTLTNKRGIYIEKVLNWFGAFSLEIYIIHLLLYFVLCDVFLKTNICLLTGYVIILSCCVTLLIVKPLKIVVDKITSFQFFHV